MPSRLPSRPPAAATPMRRSRRGALVVLPLLMALAGLTGLGASPSANAETASAAGALKPVTGSIAVAARHACAIDTESRAWCWGAEAGGRLGTGVAGTATRPEPQPVAGGHLFTQLDAEFAHTCGLDTDGAAWCWGTNVSGSLGTGSADPALVATSPVKVLGGHVFTSISTGAANTCAIDTDGAAWCWGRRPLVGNATLPTTPTAIGIPQKVAGTQTWSAISVGALTVCGLTTDGKALCWGSAGIGSAQSGAVLVPTPVDGDRTYRTITVSNDGLSSRSCAVASDFKVWCWGASGKAGVLLGNASPSTLSSVTPREAVTGFLFASLTAAGDLTCGVGVDANVRCWGPNIYAALGSGRSYGELVGSATPVKVVGSRYVGVGLSSSRTGCAIDVDTILRCWGNGQDGLRGDGAIDVYGADLSNAGQASPVPVAGNRFYGPARTVSVTAGGRSTFGTVPAAPAPVYSGFRTGGSAADLSTPATCRTTPTIAATTPAGTYPVTCSGAVGAGYVFTYVAGSWTVDKAAITLTTSATTGLVNLLKLGTRYTATVKNATTGAPVAGLAVTFTIKGAASPACTATTGADGVATCTGAINLGSYYTAAVAASANYTAASAEALIPLL